MHPASNSAEFAVRRAAVLAAIEPGVLIVAARRETSGGGLGEPFRQDSDFYYLTGFEEPDAVLVLRAGSDAPYVLFVRPRDPLRERWDGLRAGVDGARDVYGADCAFLLAELEAELPRLLEDTPRVFHLLGRDRRFDDRILDAVARVRGRARERICAPHSIVDPAGVLGALRVVKSPFEVAAMQRAADVTCSAHREVMRLARAGMGEQELDAVLLGEFRRGGARRPAYPPIVAAGGNATTLHYDRNDGSLMAGSLVLVDAGCELDHYAADVTRTFPVDGRFTPEQAAVYGVVLAAQEAALGAVRPGVTLDAVHDAAVEVLTRGLVELGMIAGPVTQAIEDGLYKPYYMHRTSHSLGLDVHDAANYHGFGGPLVLAPGMVLTVEPGLYFPPGDPGVRFAGTGVRIEDDVLVTQEGGVLLTAAAPKTLEAVEAACAR